MRDIFIWGTGKYGNLIYQALQRNKCNILGAIDADNKKHGELWNGELTIYSPEYLRTIEFDYVIVTVLHYEPIIARCNELNLNRNKIIIYWGGDNSFDYIKEKVIVMELQKEIKHYKECLLEKKSFIKSLSDKNEVLVHEKAEAIKEKIDEINRKNQIINEKIEVIKENIKLKDEKIILELKLENAPYEYGIENIPKIKPASILLEKLIKERKSMSRFGDGELELMQGNERPWFQVANMKLTKKLYEVFKSDREEVLIAVSDNFGSLEKYTESAATNIRHYLSNGKRKQLMKIIGSDREYYDAYVSRPYLMYKDKSYARKMFNLFKELWAERDVLLLEGKYMRTGVGNDLFSTVKTIRRILAPSENAFDYYDELVKIIKKHANKDDLILLCLGPTATVLAYDISELGFQAIDLGQIDNEYEWYLMKAETRVALPNKAVPELDDCHSASQSLDQHYLQQIIAKIGC